MKLSTAKRRINKTLDELTQSVIDDWYANFKNGYVKGYEDARQGKSPMYAEAYKIADTPQTEEPTMDEYYKDHDEFYDCDRYVITNDEGERAYNCIGCQTDCPWK
jgi:hypothetical protein